MVDLSFVCSASPRHVECRKVSRRAHLAHRSLHCSDTPKPCLPGPLRKRNHQAENDFVHCVSLFTPLCNHSRTPMAYSLFPLTSGVLFAPTRPPCCCVPLPASNARAPSGDRPSHAPWRPLDARARQAHGIRRPVDATHSACCSLSITLRILAALQLSRSPLLHTSPRNLLSHEIVKKMFSTVQY